jgi:hypothetical protein
MRWLKHKKLYLIGRACKEQQLSFENRKALRQDKSVPILKNGGRMAAAKSSDNTSKISNRKSDCIKS